MKKYFYLLLMMCCIIVLPSCGDDDDDDDVIDEVWKEQNDKAFNDMYFSNYSQYEAPSKAGVVFYKQSKAGNGKKIYYTSRVEAFYKGSLIDGTEFDGNNWDYDNPLKIAMNTNVSDYNASTNPNGYMTVIEGWTTILQYMTEGEEGEVWIPYQLGYGTTGVKDNDGNTTIPAYSTLIFKLKVAKVYDIDEF